MHNVFFPPCSPLCPFAVFAPPPPRLLPYFWPRWPCAWSPLLGAEGKAPGEGGQSLGDASGGLTPAWRKDRLIGGRLGPRMSWVPSPSWVPTCGAGGWVAARAAQGEPGSCRTQRDSGGGRCHLSSGTFGTLGQVPKHASGAASPWVPRSPGSGKPLGWGDFGWARGPARCPEEMAGQGGWELGTPGHLEVTCTHCPHPGDSHAALALQLLFLASPWPPCRGHQRRGRQGPTAGSCCPFPFHSLGPAGWMGTG